ncbi:MAG: NHL repeat-containing protein [candidate division Zixibacteria bacterium]|nr:NHL repeat-containing protein [candidate division Zixibacteria bacterium]
MNRSIIRSLVFSGIIAAEALLAPADGVCGADSYLADTLYVEKEFTFQTAEDGLDQPEAIAVLPDGTVIVSDTKNNRLVQFDKEGVFIKEIGALGSGKNQFYVPTDIKIGNGCIYVADQGNNRIVKLAFDLSWLGSFSVIPLPDIIAIDHDGNICVGSRAILPERHLLVKFDSNGKQLGGIGELLGSPDDPVIARTAINIVSADFIDGGTLAVCYKGLAYCRCGETAWMVSCDIDSTRAWFYQGYFPEVPLSKMTNRNKLADYMEDLKRKCEIDRASNVPLFIDQLAPFNDHILVIVSSTLHEYSCAGTLLKRTVVLKQDGTRLVYERLTVSPDGSIYLMSKYLESSCWKVRYRQPKTTED